MQENSKTHTDCYIFLLSKAYQNAHGLIQKRLKPYGLTNTQFAVLGAICSSEGIKAAELGKQLSIDKATLSGILDRMIEAGWLIKKQAPQDLRVFQIFPSKKANDLKEKLIEERNAANEELLSGFTMEERILLKRLLIDLTVITQ